LGSLTSKEETTIRKDIEYIEITYLKKTSNIIYVWDSLLHNLLEYMRKYLVSIYITSFWRCLFEFKRERMEMMKLDQGMKVNFVHL
jgi:hypothetical protein